MMNDIDKGRTELLEILRRCRVGGLSLKTEDYLAVFYDEGGLNMLFKFDDGRTYALSLKSVGAVRAED